MIPYFGTEEEPDQEALMENAQSIHPNDQHWAKEIKKAEVIIQRRNELFLTIPVRESLAPLPCTVWTISEGTPLSLEQMQPAMDPSLEAEG